jgi:hypothetical protein
MLSLLDQGTTDNTVAKWTGNAVAKGTENTVGKQIKTNNEHNLM